MITVTLRKQPDTNRESKVHSSSISPDLINWRVMMRQRAWRPATDVYEADDQIIVRMEIAGVSEENFVINVDRNELIIQGIREDVKERRAYHQMEIPYGEFCAEIDLPIPIDLEKVHAAYRDGFLTVVLPKALPKHIPIIKA